MVGCLVIHGYTGGPYELEPLTNYLQEYTNWDIQLPVLPGHGRKLNLKGVSYKKWMKTAENVLNQLKAKYETIYVIGFSMGGMIAAYLAAIYKVDKLVLLATSGKYLSFRQIGVDIAEMINDGLHGRLRKNRLFIHYKKKLGEVPFMANIEFLKLVRHTRRYLHKVNVPVFIVQGQQDGMVPAKTAYYLDKEISSAHKEVVFFERSKHLICLGNDKEALNLMVYDFLMKPIAEI